jgi:hypothetical protein
VTPPDVADIVTTVADVTAFVVTTNPAVVAPAGTVTLAGTPATVVLLLDSVTIAPPVGAAALSVTVPVDVLPQGILAGWRLSDVSVAAGVTESCADRVAPPLVPEIVAVVDVVTALAATANVAVVLPAATLTAPGTVATAVLLLASVTTAPPVGAAALSVTVPIDVLPPRTLVGWRVSDVSPGAPGVFQVTPPSVLCSTPDAVAA